MSLARKLLAGDTGEWSDVHYPVLDTNHGSWTGFTVRQHIGSSLVLVTGGSLVRVTLKAATVGGFTLDKIYIGHAKASADVYDFDAAPTQLLFSGAAGVTVASSGTIVSDAAAFVIQPSKALIVSMYFSAAANSRYKSLAGCTAYYKAVDEAATVNVTGYSPTGTTNYNTTVDRIESFG